MLAVCVKEAEQQRRIERVEQNPSRPGGADPTAGTQSRSSPEAGSEFLKSSARLSPVHDSHVNKEESFFLFVNENENI